MTQSISDLVRYLDNLFPRSLAEGWDNTGLLVGDANRRADNVMTCLTLTGATLREAVREHANIIVTHHPFPFHAVKQITNETVTGRLLLELVEHQIAIYSPHTSHDSAANGINQQWAELLKLTNVRPLIPQTDDETIGTGRIGTLTEPVSIITIVHFIKNKMRLDTCQYVGTPTNKVLRVAVTCGAADELVEQAKKQNAELLIMGEARFHTCLEAEADNLSLIIPGHYASERFALEYLAERIKMENKVNAWASKDERNPIRTR
ncbi:MAG: Nif3-like dinuclear metal center hexameric protein [Planctomycetaceae bacterium]|jgi:dinuclear metal center YbgI/SA1388 family protein|nr:Nif3-like dinuclear metal center hexameric protein [Planctomycetaceae bacterium]